MNNSKSFRLVVKRPNAFQPSTNAAFASDSDDEEPTKMKMPKISLTKHLKAASSEDLYEYDSIYDDTKAQVAKTTHIPSKYVGALVKAANKRKRDKERKLERKIRSEREKEGDNFNDKDVFVTGAYKKKLKQLEDEELREQQKNLFDETMRNDPNGHLIFQLRNIKGRI